jgi:hypothetical protein
MNQGVQAAFTSWKRQRNEFSFSTSRRKVVPPPNNQSEIFFEIPQNIK